VLVIARKYLLNNPGSLSPNKAGNQNYYVKSIMSIGTAKGKTKESIRIKAVQPF